MGPGTMCQSAAALVYRYGFDPQTPLDMDLTLWDSDGFFSSDTVVIFTINLPSVEVVRSLVGILLA
jgi:hypothetical protein